MRQMPNLPMGLIIYTRQEVLFTCVIDTSHVYVVVVSCARRTDTWLANTYVCIVVFS